MRRLLHLVAMVLIFLATSGLWMAFAGVMALRTEEQESGLSEEVAELWGQPLVQIAPQATRVFSRTERREDAVYGADGKPLTRDGVPVRAMRDMVVEAREPLPIVASRVDVDMAHDPRRKGLIWFSLYDVAFDGRYTVRYEGTEPTRATVNFPFPQHDGMYDDFRFEVDGRPIASTPTGNGAEVWVDLAPGQAIVVHVAYRSRGRDSFQYRPLPGWATGEVRDLQLVMHTDFADIDFPGRTLSPSARAETDDGWTLTWTFEHLITGSGMGMITPRRVQPGELASKMSLTAPISLGLFMLWIAVLGLLRGVVIHPVNHAFLAAAFFSFHLLFGYTADHLPIEAAFALSSVTSVLLTVSYLRLVAGPRFAIVQAGGAQIIYQVVFSLAHFADGMTGLTLTVLLVGTLFALMQLTGRIRWDEVFAEPAPLPAS